MGILSKSNEMVQKYSLKVFKEMAPLLAEESFNRKNGIIVEPDTTAADMFFLLSFLTKEMEDDFPLIVQSFVENCGEKLTKYDDIAWYDETYIGVNKPKVVLYNSVLRLLYNGAKTGDSFCTKEIINLYKTYHKKEYKQIKLYNKLSGEIISNIIDEYDIKVQIYAFARILGIARFLGIQLDDTCVFFYKIFDKRRDAFFSWVEKSTESQEIPSDVYDSAVSEVDKWILEANEKPDMTSKYKQANDFTNFALRLEGFQDNYEFLCMNHFKGPREHLTTTLAILKTIYSDRTFTFEEVQVFSHMRDILLGLVNVAKDFDYELRCLLGGKLYDEDFANARYKPVKNNEQSIENKETENLINTATISKGEVSKKEYLEVIDSLRSRINKIEKENSFLRGENKELSKKIREQEMELSQSQANQKELYSLREYVYSLTNEDDMSESVSVDDMEKSISDKKIIIIGGHTKWHKKLKERFNNWKCIQTDKLSSLDPAITDGYDEVYFFTDFIGHSEYKKFASYLNKRKDRLKYLHGVNIDNMVKRIYKDMKKV